MVLAAAGADVEIASAHPFDIHLAFAQKYGGYLVRLRLSGQCCESLAAARHRAKAHPLKRSREEIDMKSRTRTAATAAPVLAGLCLLCSSIPPSAHAQNRSDGNDDPSPAFANRRDIRNLPDPLKDRLQVLAARPHTYLPARVFNEAPKPSRLFQYYLIDTIDFEPNVFTAVIPGINDGTRPTATGPNGQLPAVGSVRLVVEPKAGFPTDPNDVRALIDVFTDVSGLFVINNESGWYEGWMIHDLKVPRVAPARPSGRAQYGTITAEDAAALAARGTHNDVPGNFFSTDGNVARLPSATDHFPDVQSNEIPFPVSIGTFNASQQSDIHAYWEFNTGTNWVFPHYELPFTGGIPGTFAAGKVGALQSIVPGSGPSGVRNNPLTYGDDPSNPRDPDRGELSNVNDPDRPTPGNPAHLETRNRFIPSGLTDELLQDVFTRVRSFEADVTDPAQRFFDAYAYEVSLVDQNGDGVISFVEADVNGTSDGLPNTRLYLPATAFDRFAMTREIDDGLLAPRFGPGQRGYVMSGLLTLVNPAVPASLGRDGDNR